MTLLHKAERPRRSGRTLLAALLTGTALVGTSGAAAQTADKLWCDPGCGGLVADWGLTAYAAIRAEDGYADPLAASRALAIMHVAMHDAVNAAHPRYQTHAVRDGDAQADPAVAAAVAAHDVLVGLYPDQTALFAAELEKALLDAGVGPAVNAGRALGETVAAGMFEERASDGADGSETYVESDLPGRYRFVPEFDFIAAPHWRHLRPFVLEAPDQFRTAPPPAMDSAAYAAAFAEVKATGGTVAPARDADETAYAAFWYEFSDIGWNRVTRVAAREAGLDLWDSARLFALVNMALADSYIAGWDSKLHYDAWRPVTAIRLAGEDGNPATEADASWGSYLTTPPIQDHPSTHSVLGAAAATVLAEVLGDDFAFSMTSTTALPEAPARGFARFSEAAEENAESRIQAGLHFRYATDAGLDLGRKIGALAARELPAALY
jgi:PAP2 superfamily